MTYVRAVNGQMEKSTFHLHQRVSKREERIWILYSIIHISATTTWKSFKTLNELYVKVGLKKCLQIKRVCLTAIECRSSSGVRVIPDSVPVVLIHYYTTTGWFRGVSTKLMLNGKEEIWNSVDIGRHRKYSHSSTIWSSWWMPPSVDLGWLQTRSGLTCTQHW